MNKHNKLIVGGGMAGLCIAYHLDQRGDGDYQLYEGANSTGGLARSFKWHEVDCDAAPHRLFTSDEAILQEMLSLVDCIKVNRKSQIFLAGKTIIDPVNIVELVIKFFPIKSSQLVFSFLKAKWLGLFFKTTKASSFDSFVVTRYGNALNELFFKPYAEKLFAIKSTEISAKWGESKIRVSGLKDLIRRNSKLYFRYFYYPKKGGYGAFVDVLNEQVEDRTKLNHRLEKIDFDASTQTYKCHFKHEGKIQTVSSKIIISGLPITQILSALGHETRLRYRGLNLVYLHLDMPQMSQFHWQYIIDSDSCVNRVSEFKNFSADEKTPNKQQTQTTVICAEVTDRQDFNVERVIEELVERNCFTAEQVLDTKVIFIERAYPIYEVGYSSELSKAHEILAGYPNLYCVGRQAEFRHQDIDEIFASAKKLSYKIAAQN